MVRVKGSVVCKRESGGGEKGGNGREVTLGRGRMGGGARENPVPL